MRNTWKAVVVALSLVGPVALAQEDDWESPVTLTAEDDWETPLCLYSEDDWETPIALTGEDDWESPIALTGEDDWETPLSLAPQGGRAGDGESSSSSCLKAAVLTGQPEASRAALPVQGFLNICGGRGAERWLSAEVMDAAWRDSYVREQDGQSIYRAHVYQDAAGWHGLLYNFRLGRWEEKAFAAR